MRLPYAPSTPPADASTSAIYARVLARRAPRPLQPLDLTLLHSPHVADGWNSFLGAIRTQTTLGEAIREIAICRVAVLNGANYEWAHHAPLARRGGVSDEGMAVLVREDVLEGGPAAGRGLDERMWAVVRYTDEMTRNVRVPDDVFAELRRLFSDQEVVEITATVGPLALWSSRADSGERCPSCSGDEERRNGPFC